MNAHLAEHVRKQRLEPVVAEVKHLDLVVRQEGLNRARGAVRGEAVRDLLICHVPQPLPPQPEQQPLGEQRAQRRLVVLVG